ncbi:unnamed protein product [Polarella glacialis]|uniref:Thioesterase domain-containing protein n=2 Tax=Polarella glacialis TaxID=89957 RepID=A0A813K1F1_POLGL|nr:unnamed protein product [Polarella glacialis]
MANLEANDYIVCASPQLNAKVRLVCFPHAGGGPSAFAAWGDLLEDKLIEVVAVSAPGRERRIHLPPITDSETLIQEICEAIEATGIPDGLPYAFFGHSLGAVLAFEVARQLDIRMIAGRPRPLHVFASGHGGPSTMELGRDVGNWGRLHTLSDAELMETISTFGFVPDDLATNKDLLRAVVPALRGDFQLYEDYKRRSAAKDLCSLESLLASAGLEPGASAACGQECGPAVLFGAAGNLLVFNILASYSFWCLKMPSQKQVQEEEEVKDASIKQAFQTKQTYSRHFGRVAKEMDWGQVLGYHMKLWGAGFGTTGPGVPQGERKEEEEGGEGDEGYSAACWDCSSSAKGLLGLIGVTFNDAFGRAFARHGVPCVQGFSTMRDISELPSSKKKIVGRFGVEWFTGRRPTEINARDVELPKAPYNPAPYKMAFNKYPGIVSGLGAEYFYREGQKSPVTYYHMRSPRSGDTVMVGATDGRAREARTLENYWKEKTRGFAAQIVLEGRGVKAYFEPDFPKLKARLGVGAKVKDLTEYCLRDPDCKVSCSKKGDVVVVHGPTKARVGTLAYRLLKQLQPRLLPYTGKGAHFAFHPAKRKAMRKK